MVVLYFSGTGNSKYIAESFAADMNYKCFSIEEKIDFSSIIGNSDIIAICYPIYGSCVPRIMREFTAKNLKLFEGKKLIILSTQLMFSGDGARVFTDLLGNINYSVLYAEHFNMPNNICNTSIFKVTNGDENKMLIDKADKKLNTVCRNIKSGKVHKRGFNSCSKAMGFLGQRSMFEKGELHKMSSVKINHDCTACGLCVKICPMQNLVLENSTIEHNNNCTLCFRCVNLCPNKAITTLLNSPVRTQYKGISQINYV